MNSQYFWLSTLSSWDLEICRACRRLRGGCVLSEGCLWSFWSLASKRVSCSKLKLLQEATVGEMSCYAFVNTLLICTRFFWGSMANRFWGTSAERRMIYLPWWHFPFWYLQNEWVWGCWQDLSFLPSILTLLLIQCLNTHLSSQ